MSHVALTWQRVASSGGNLNLTKAWTAVAIPTSLWLCPSPATALDLLAAAGPAAEHRAELMQFGRLVGLWNLDIRLYDGAGHETRHAKGKWEFGWVLEGRAVQDVFIVYGPSKGSPAAAATPSEYGTTLRVYDHQIGGWRVVYSGPLHGQMLQFIGRQVGEDLVLQRQEEDGALTHWTFSAIRSGSFRWEATTSRDGGRTWTTDQVMLATRQQSAAQSPLP